MTSSTGTAPPPAASWTARSWWRTTPASWLTSPPSLGRSGSGRLCATGESRDNMMACYYHESGFSPRTRWGRCQAMWRWPTPASSLSTPSWTPTASPWSGPSSSAPVTVPGAPPIVRSARGHPISIIIIIIIIITAGGRHVRQLHQLSHIHQPGRVQHRLLPAVAQALRLSLLQDRGECRHYRVSQNSCFQLSTGCPRKNARLCLKAPRGHQKWATDKSWGGLKKFRKFPV